MKNVVEKIGESIFGGPEQEVALLRFDNWKGEYVRIEYGEDMVDEIDGQDGWTTKQTMFHAELVDLKTDSKVGYVPSKLASQMVDDDWASERQIMPMCTGEVTVLPEGGDAEDGSEGVGRVVYVDWNSVELNDPTDLVIAPMDDTEMAKKFGIPVADEDKEEKDGESSMPTDTDANKDRTEDLDG